MVSILGRVPGPKQANRKGQPWGAPLGTGPGSAPSVPEPRVIFFTHLWKVVMDGGSMFSSPVLLVFVVLVLVVLKLGVKIVPQSENWLVERLGKFNRKLEAGLHLIIPFFESVRFKVSIQERQLPPKPINAITLDNVTISVSLAVLYRIVDASKTMYRIANVDDAIMTIVNGTVRSVIGKTDLDGGAVQPAPDFRRDRKRSAIGL